MKLLFSSFFLLNICAHLACQSTLTPVSRRVFSSDEDSKNFLIKKRQLPNQNPSAQKRQDSPSKAIRIEPSEDKPKNASLFRIANPMANLYGPPQRALVGSVLEVFVRANAESEKQAENDQNSNVAERSADELEKDLLAALPELKGEDDSQPRVMTKIPFKIIRKLENGDVLANYRRMSESDGSENLIDVNVKIPAEVVASQRPITTSNLQDIDWQQLKDTKTIRKQSLAWEDEYSLRISGFTEAKSKEAIDLEKKRRDLMALRDTVRNRIIGLGQQRRVLNDEKQKVEQMKNQMDQKVSNLESAIAEKDSTINEQKEIIRRQEEALQSNDSTDQLAEGGSNE